MNRVQLEKIEFPRGEIKSRNRQLLEQAGYLVIDTKEKTYAIPNLTIIQHKEDDGFNLDA